MIEFAVPHTLAFTFFPAWVSDLRERFGPIKSRLIALNVHDAVMRLVEGSCDLLIAYHHSAHPFQLDPQRFEMVNLGQEVIAPYSRPLADGTPQFALPGRAGSPLPYLGYAPGAYLGQMVDLILKQSPAPIHFDRVYETDMAEGLKAMAVEGHGVAFLPHSAVKKELRNRRLVSALPPDMSSLQLTMEVRAYRERPNPSEGHRNPTANGKPVATTAGKGKTGSGRVDNQTLWNYLVAASADNP
jgi:LysR family transcriptional regulator, hypochlorite-specific transcription factor HypT